MNIQVYPPEQQGVGSFDHGKFKEQRPIGFSGDRSAIDRLGPLFYWAWGRAEDIAEIGMHPHQAFEIMTYVLKGVVEHQDSLGSQQTVTAGGAQVMQAGSGIYHGEAFREVGSEGLQIWFEPHLQEAITQPPTYHQYNHDQFPIVEHHGVIQKTIIGLASPIHIRTETQVLDLTITPESTYTYPLPAGRILAYLTIEGVGNLSDGTPTDPIPFQYRDFVVIRSEHDQVMTVQANPGRNLRIITIEVPAHVNYPLYQK